MPDGVVVTTPEEATDVVSHIGKIQPSGIIQQFRLDMLIQARRTINAKSPSPRRRTRQGTLQQRRQRRSPHREQLVCSTLTRKWRASSLSLLRPSEAYTNASNMLGHHLTTKQTPPGGILVTKLYIYKAVDVVQEYYLAMTFDRSRLMPVLLVSDDGGVNIESNTDKLQRFGFHLSHGITAEISAYIQAQLGFSDADMKVLDHILRQMVKLFREKDAILLELNPLVRTAQGDFVCLDAKFSFDDSARFRQQELFSMEERSPEEEVEYEASQLGLSYVRLDGYIGNIVNGAGLAMATNDLITLFGGKCANFLDVGGGATKETLSKAFEILKGDSRIRGTLVNIYGGELAMNMQMDDSQLTRAGIVRCDMIAEAIIAAAMATGGFKVPVVVRLQGTNCEKALRLVSDEVCSPFSYKS